MKIAVMFLFAVLAAVIWFIPSDDKDEAGQPWADPEAERKLDR